LGLGADDAKVGTGMRFGQAHGTGPDAGVHVRQVLLLKLFAGMGMPKVISAQVEEMMNSASLAFGLYPMLTSGACLSIYAHA
ncbi:hypothetical protein AB1A63_15235, partial [Lactiplantibacillus paraplantarum]|uniref:hypothetical protein n=1 Tax=Lactiplantibacillus paraplantarum TaxID=60520 RepID=UPI003453A407